MEVREEPRKETHNQQGFDNAAVLYDDGASRRPDLVINVQPRGQDRNRAELPVSTVDWRSASPQGGSFIPMNGLDFLIGVTCLHIQQTVELNDMTSKIESENRYIVRVPNGEALYLASEVSSSTQRCLCGSGRSFRMHLHDNTRQEALTLERRLAAASCCFPCRLQEMKVITPPGDYVGRIQQRWTWVVPFYLVRDANEDVLFVLEGPAVISRNPLLLSEFRIMTGDSLREVGKISHRWDRELVSFMTTVTFPPAAVQPKHKALLLAAAFLMASSCVPPPTKKQKTWLYDEYYIGDKDAEGRKHGQGENHWTGAKSMEWYRGHMVRGTMNGLGHYRWRYSGPEYEFVTYEGQFFANQMHGYGAMSYPDGRVFYGLYHSNIRWGPGVEDHACLRANVGFWRSNQLVRLAWKPDAPCIVPDLTNSHLGPAFVEPFRISLTKNEKIIEDTNPARELLKVQGADPEVAAKKWPMLYPKNCTDLQSLLCQEDAWTHDCYDGKIQWLGDQKSEDRDEKKGAEKQDIDDLIIRSLWRTSSSTDDYYAWNNSPAMVEMMKHCYKHDQQRRSVKLNLELILSGPRKRYRPPADHERDCRALLMACYLGHTVNVTQLINESDVHTNIADVQGNTAIMYATCGHQEKIIHFLVEAGADVNAMNDSCCTALGVALMWYLCAVRDVAPKDMLQSLLPSKIGAASPKKENISEWLINRDQKSSAPIRERSQTSQVDKKAMKVISNTIANTQNSKSDAKKYKKTEEEYDSDTSFNEEKRLYWTINTEYEIRVSDLFGQSMQSKTEYIFEVRDMFSDVLASDVIPPDPKTSPSKKTNMPTPSKKVDIPTEPIKTSKEAIRHEYVDTAASADSIVKLRQETLAKKLQTIQQLLSDGADPSMVNSPKPALFLAIASGNATLIRDLVHHGADVNEEYPESFNYTPLEVAAAIPLAIKRVEMMQSLLECGADPNHRMKMPQRSTAGSAETILGPTLLHVMLAKTESEDDVIVRDEIIKLLLQYDCDPTVKFMGQSAIAMAMSKKFDMLNYFVQTPTLVGLNAIINDNNQTILVKMFSASYFSSTIGTDQLPTLTNLLLYGADPLIECHDGDDTYGNIFEFTEKTLYKDFGYNAEAATAAAGDSKTRGKQGKGKPPLPDRSDSKLRLRKPQFSGHVVAEYLSTVQFMTQVGMMMHIRWIQAKLMRELVDVIWKFQHRHWTMITKEHSNKKRVGLWLYPQRCLEMWDIFKPTQPRMYQDDQVLKHLLSIVQFYNKRWSADKSFKRKITCDEKDAIDTKTVELMKEHRATKLREVVENWMEKYVKPELCSMHDTKFDICFECALPLKYEEGDMLCSLCQLIWFCSMKCLKKNVVRSGRHPCSDYLMKKHFPGRIPSKSLISSE